MEESILQSTKNKLGVSSAQTVFDDEILGFINTAFGTLHQLGIGPEAGYVVDSIVDEWDAFFDDSVDPIPQAMRAMIKTYVYLVARVLFDPPSVSFVLRSLQDQIREHEWRLSVYRDEYKGTA
jgi:hypothetical protein